jgi:hypothetical protein
MKRVGAGLVLAAVFLVVSATAALANHGVGSGSAVCNRPEGTITYTFNVVSSGKTPGDVTTRLGNGSTPFTASETVPGTQTTDSLEWHITFHENSGNVIHGHGTITVNFTPDCTATPTSPPPTSPPPTSPPPTSPPPSHHSHSPSPTTHVRGTGGSSSGGTGGTGGTAVTGSNATPIAGAALALLVVGLGLLWVARERAR